VDVPIGIGVSRQCAIAYPPALIAWPALRALAWRLITIFALGFTMVWALQEHLLRLRSALALLALVAGVSSSALAAERSRDPFLRSSFYGPTTGVVQTSGMSPAAGESARESNDAPLSEAMYQTAMATDFDTAEVGDAPLGDVDVTLTGYSNSINGYDCRACGHFWQAMPDGLIYRSYQAGPRESRIGTQFFHNQSSLQNSEVLWDATVGGRRGLFRYGTGDALRPEGWQLDIEGAAIVRLNLDEDRDVDSSDFRFGVPLTYGSGNVQYKIGYYHLSSHLGDELITRTGVNNRINYVRDAIIMGVSYNPRPELRVYGETAYAAYTAGGAEPWEFQFGLEYSHPAPTGFCGTPFFATNVHLREEIDFSGDWTTQFGWLWRGASGSTMRLGLHYMNGKSTQYQFLNVNEEQLGFGAWYDF